MLSGSFISQISIEHLLFEVTVLEVEKLAYETPLPLEF